MKYHGGKFKLGEKIAGAIVDITNRLYAVGYKFDGYIEPFVGLCSVFKHTAPRLSAEQKITRFGIADQHTSIMLMWQAVQDGWVPPTDISYEQFIQLRDSEPSPEKAFAGFQCSQYGQFFITYCKDAPLARYSAEVVQIGALLKEHNVSVQRGTYVDTTNDLYNHIIYADPPYASQTSYFRDDTRKVLKFDHDGFWQWAREASEHNLVIVSEMTYPADFVPVSAFETQYSKRQSGQGCKRGHDLLLVHESWHKRIGVPPIDVPPVCIRPSRTRRRRVEHALHADTPVGWCGLPLPQFVWSVVKLWT